MPPSLKSVRLKQKWAYRHFNNLKTEILGFLDGKLYNVSEHTNVTCGQPVGEPEYVIIDQPIAPDPWGLWIGDIAYNLRASLDHLAKQLAILDNPTIPPDELALTEFPIFQFEWGYKDHAGRDRPGYRSPGGGRGLRKIRQLSADHQDRITSFQPYPGAPHAAENAPLLALHQVRNIDAHQELHVALVAIQLPQKPFTTVRRIAETKYAITVWSSEGEEHLQMDIAVGDSAEVASYVEGNFPAKVVFNERRCPVVHQQEVLPLLHAMGVRVQAVIDAFESDFPK
jgi:hypothetical protein